MAEREERIILIRVDASAAIDGSRAATSALERMERAQGQAAASLGRLETALGRVGFWLKGQLIIMAADLGSRLVQMAKQAFEAAAGLDELAEQLGISTKGLQALQFAATQNGVKLEQLETGVSKFSQKIGEAAAGNKEMLESLNGLGVKILDVNGKLRPTEAIMQNVAAAIVAIDDPAKRAAAAVDFFGKAGTRMLPLLPSIASGFAEMGAAASKAGAMISSEAIAKLDKLSNSGERTKLVMRTMFAEVAAGPLASTLDFISGKFQNLITLIKQARDDLTALLALAANPAAYVARMFASTPTEKLASDIEAQRKAITAGEDALAKLGPNDLRRGYTQRSVDQAKAALQALERQQGVALVGGRASADPNDPDNMGVYVLPRSAAGGASNPPPKSTGGGNAEADRIAKLRRDTARELAEQMEAAEAAAAGGAKAVGDLEVKYKALKAAQDAYGNTADKNKGQVAALADEIGKLMDAADRAKNLKDFSLGTEQLEKQNQLLEAENRLINESVEVRAREIALIKVRQEVASKGLDETNQKEREAIERREAAITQNERLKAQGEELKRAQELWTEPLKQALRDIQSTAADAFQQMLESGNFSFEALGQTFKKIITRMIAEFLALSTIRPVMSVVVNAIGGSGAAAQLGLGGGASTGSLMGGGGIFDLLGNLGGSGGSSGGGGGLLSNLGLGGIGTWMNTPFTGGFSGIAPLPAGVMGPAPNTAVGGLSGVGGSGLGFTPGGIASGAFGIGMGALSLANGGTKTTAGTIGGIGQMVGGALMMIPTGFTQIAGAIVMALSSILPGLIGTPDPVIDNATAGQLRYGSGGFFSTGGAWGPSANASAGQAALMKTAPAISAIFDLFGGVKDPSQVWGMNLDSWSKGNSKWNYTSQSTYLVDPQGNATLWRENMDDMMDTGAAQVALRSILGGAVGEISQDVRNLAEVLRITTAPLERVVEMFGRLKALEKAMEDFGKDISDAESAIRQINESFDAMTAEAKALHASQETLVAIDAERIRQQRKITDDFAFGISQSLLEFTDPAQAQLNALEKARQEDLKRNADFLRLVYSYSDQRLQIEDLYQRRRNEIIEQSNAATIAATKAAMDDLNELIKSLLPGGANSNLDPTGQLAGLSATYSATRAQAFAGNADAIDRFSQDASAYAQFAQTYFAGSPEYNAIRDRLLADAMSLQNQIGGGVTPTATAGSSGTVSGAQVAQLMAIVQQQSAEIARLTSLLTSYITNGKRAA